MSTLAVVRYYKEFQAEEVRLRLSIKTSPTHEDEAKLPAALSGTKA